MAAKTIVLYNIYDNELKGWTAKGDTNTSITVRAFYSDAYLHVKPCKMNFVEQDS